MTVKSLASDNRKDVLKNIRRSLACCATFEALDKLAVAELSAAVINDMTCDELVRMIRVATLPALLRSDLERHLPFYDHTVLKRLAHLASRCCRKQGPGSFRKDAE